MVQKYSLTLDDGKTITAEKQKYLNIFFQIEFPRLPCYLLHFNAIDPISKYYLPLDLNNITFHRLNEKGELISNTPFNMSFFSNYSIPECGPCYFNKTTDECCHTCQDVLDYYEIHGRNPRTLYNFPQCKHLPQYFSSMDNEGCLFTTDFRALPLKSEFHISPGYPWHHEMVHYHMESIFQKPFKNLNISHHIRYLNFFDTLVPQTLDNHTVIQTESGSQRTTYLVSILDDEYSVSEFTRKIASNVSPGVVIIYDISPITAITYLEKQTISHLFTRLLTVVGGVLCLLRVVQYSLLSVQRSKSKTLEELQE